MKKRSSLEKRINRLNKQIMAVNSDIKALSKAAEKGSSIDEIPRLKSEKQLRASKPVKAAVPQNESTAVEARSIKSRQHDGMEAERIVQQQAKKASQAKDERLKDFLAANFQSVGPLRHERQKQRNKAIFVIIVVIIFIIWMWVK